MPAGDALPQPSRAIDKAGLPGGVVLVLQGGGAPGCYQGGAYQALHEAGIEPDWVVGTSIGAINAAIGGWYYLRVVGAIYLRTPLKPIEKARTWPGLVAIWVCAILTIGLGVYPWPAVRAARQAIFPQQPTLEQPQAQR